MRDFRDGDKCPVRATTLVELLVAMAVTMSVMVLLAMIVSSVSEQWRGGSSRYLLNTEAGVALDYLVRDLSSVARKGDGSEWLRILQSNTGDPIQDFLMLMVARPLDGGGKVSTIAYRLVYHDPMKGGELRPVMYRCVFPPEDSIEHLGAVELESAWESRLEEVEDDDWFLAENVIEVAFTFYLRDSDGKKVVIECNNEVSARKNLEVDGVPVTGGGTTLESAAVRLTLLEETGLQLLREGAVPLPEIVSRYGHEFVEEVAFTEWIGGDRYEM